MGTGGTRSPSSLSHWPWSIEMDESSFVAWVAGWVVSVQFLLPCVKAHLLHGGYKFSQLDRGEDSSFFSVQPISELMDRQELAIPRISEELHELTLRLTWCFIFQGWMTLHRENKPAALIHSKIHVPKGLYQLWKWFSGPKSLRAMLLFKFQNFSEPFTATQKLQVGQSMEVRPLNTSHRKPGS